MRHNRKILMRVALVCSVVATALFWVSWQQWPRDPTVRQVVEVPSARGLSAPEPSNSSSTSSKLSKPTLADPQPGDKPKWVEVVRGDKTIVKRATFGRGTSMTVRADGRPQWSPEPGAVEWHQLNGHLRPGQTSRKTSIIAGHVAYGDGGDVFATLKEVKKKDEVIVRYKSGATTEFVVTEIITKDKELLTKSKELWNKSSKPSQQLALITCDAGSGYNDDGTRKDNRVVFATRIK